MRGKFFSLIIFFLLQENKYFVAVFGKNASVLSGKKRFPDRSNISPFSPPLIPHLSRIPSLSFPLYLT